MTIRAVVFDIGGVLVECERMDFGPNAHLGERLADVRAAGAIGGISEAEMNAAREFGFSAVLFQDTAQAIADLEAPLDRA